MSEYGYGDYVAYDPGYREPEIGRVTRARGDVVFVCYSDGCTAAATPRAYVRPATAAETARASERLGYHRFDDACPQYDPRCCFGCIHDESRRQVG